MTSRVLGFMSFDIADELAREFKLNDGQEERCAQILRKHFQQLPDTLQKMIDHYVIGSESGATQ